MYYSSGNYEAFVRPLKPEGVERKSAYIVGTGLAALTAACYLVRDGQMPGKMCIRDRVDAVRCVLRDFKQPVLDAEDGIFQTEIECGALPGGHVPHRFSLGNCHRQP